MIDCVTPWVDLLYVYVFIIYTYIYVCTFLYVSITNDAIQQSYMARTEIITIFLTCYINFGITTLFLLKIWLLYFTGNLVPLFDITLNVTPNSKFWMNGFSLQKKLF